MAAGDAQIHNARTLAMGDDAGTIRRIGCTTDGALHAFGHPRFQLTQDLTANDTDKTFTVPAATLWWVHWIHVGLINTATVGSRIIVLRAHDASANLILQVRAGANFAASTGGRIEFIPGATYLTATIGGDLTVPLPPRFLLGAGSDIQILDVNAIDPAADDMLVTIGHDAITI